MCSYKPHLTDPATAEAYAAREGVKLCQDKGFHTLMLEGDAQAIVTALCSTDGGQGRYGSLISDSRNVLDHFNNWKVNYVSRECNVSADTLAKWAATHRTQHIWVGSYPNFIGLNTFLVIEF
jgi:ribonuclease HI